jgi:hypothetical protein
MVSAVRTPRGAGRLIPPGILAALALLAALLAVPGAARAQNDTLYFLTVKKGMQTPTGDTLFTNLERDHGPLLGNRTMAPEAIDLDIYGVSSGSAGLGLGVEVNRSEKTFSFRDPGQALPPELATVRIQGVLFTLKAYLRWGIFLPFVGAGLGNYYVNYEQDVDAFAIRAAADQVYTARAGFRLLLGRLGLLLEVGNTTARVNLDTPSGPSTLELGGPFTFLGLSWVF